jgi:hypothetical protein
MIISFDLIGDTHNFGRRVQVRGNWVHKPRTLAWEELFLSAKSPLRRLVPLEHLPDLRFRKNEAQRIALEPLPRRFDPIAVARLGGQSIALWSWFGVTDLHWENLALGLGEHGPVLAPIDIEMVLEDFSSPEQTRLIPERDPEYGAIYRHASGIRRVLPWLGKPIDREALDAMVGAYDDTFEMLDRNAQAIADVLAKMHVERIPIRVTLRSTAEYHEDRADFLDAEREQLDRGDVPYFFRLYGRPGVHFWADKRMKTVKTLPLDLAPLLSIARGFRSRNRKKLRERGAAAIRRALGPNGAVYLPCRCGEGRAVIVTASRCSS